MSASTEIATATRAAATQFLLGMGVPQQGVKMPVNIANPLVAIVSCGGLHFGGAQLRCLETAHELTTYGLKAVCIDGSRLQMPQLSNLDYLPGVNGSYCQAGVDQLLARPSIEVVIFLRKLPINMRWGKATKSLREFRRRSNASILLDTMDFQGVHHCFRDALWRTVDGVIFDSRFARARVLGECGILKAKPFFFIEHFHSVVKRVGHGAGSVRKVLLAQEHEFVSDKTCGWIKRVMPASVSGAGSFECRALSTSSRARFLSRQVGLPIDVVHEIRGRPNGTGALFTATFRKYDLLINWRAANGTVQRLSNYLASGVPVISIWSEAYADAFKGYPLLWADSYAQLGTWAHALAESPTLRRATSAAGVAAVEQFSRRTIMMQYHRGFCAVVREQGLHPHSRLCQGLEP